MKALLLVFVGGGLGSTLRYLIGKFLNAPDMSFPWGTFLVNIIGSFLVGLAFGWLLEKNKFTDDLMFFLVVGFCGGFTTFSAFAHESLTFLRYGYFNLFAIYVLTSLVVGLFCVWLGYALIKFI
ncbi:MAG: fluoride efflux transporter CrcB [Flavobacteriaceae bacterium]|nr:fluoride efflux transporter CrcB [Flavobacteriaceae bacterium]